MRLINTITFDIEEFYGSELPDYAILSHAWAAQEISFQQWTTWRAEPDKNAAIANMDGFKKIQGACARARAEKLDWLWVDTNCIDKTSSAELSEAINSMFAWYRDSKICYAYLADVATASVKCFRDSRWFTRGWTLQELLAPKNVVFYTQSWLELGRKDGSLIFDITQTTKIDVPFLLGAEDLQTASVAKRMSWLAHRKTTRPEDMAYCMLGIFDINMPLLYGEGMKAFTRLQEEIVRTYNDHTLFCWTWHDGVPTNWVSMLAPSPSVFHDSAEYAWRGEQENLVPYSMTNLGLSISLPVVYTLSRLLFVVLNAGLGNRHTSSRACICVHLSVNQGTMFERVPFLRSPVELELFHPHLQSRYNLIVQSRPTLRALKPFWPPMTSQFGLLMLIEPRLSLLFCHPSKRSAQSGVLQNPATVKQFDVPTNPPHLLDTWTSLLTIPRAPRAGLETPYHAALMKLLPWRKDGNGADYQEANFLFVMVKANGDPVWYCSIVTEAELVQDGLGPLVSLQDAYEYLKARTWAQWDGKQSQMMQSSSGGLRVSIMQPLRNYDSAELRPCVLSVSPNKDLTLKDEIGDMQVTTA